MIRKTIRIDEEACNGCGACAAACHEGAIEMIGGKARLVREHYCDGLGDCLPACPAGAISFEEREAPAYDEAAVLAAKQQQRPAPLPRGCAAPVPSQLSQWPVQIQLVPVRAPYFDGADLLVAADCTAFAYGNFHSEFIRGRVTLIGCPKLDSADYSEKLAAILANNNIRSLTVVRMEVPCCGGLVSAAKQALQASGKPVPWKTAVISRDGKLLD